MGYDLIRYLINRLFCGDSLEEGPRFLARIRDTAFNELDVELTKKGPGEKLQVLRAVLC